MGLKTINSYAEGLKEGVPIGLGYLSVSFAFGIMVVGDGFSALTAAAISMTSVTSAGQFAGLSIMTAGGTLAELVLTQLIINLRYALMSTTLSQRFDGSVSILWRALLSFFVTDEIFAVAASRNELLGKRYFMGLATAPYVGWSLGTILGALCGGILPGSVRSALGIAIYAMFIAIIIPPAKENRAIRVVLVIACVLSCIMSFTPFISAVFSSAPGFTVIICTVAAAAAGAYFFPMPCEPEQEVESA